MPLWKGFYDCLERGGKLLKTENRDKLKDLGQFPIQFAQILTACGQDNA